MWFKKKKTNRSKHNSRWKALQYLDGLDIFWLHDEWKKKQQKNTDGLRISCRSNASSSCSYSEKRSFQPNPAALCSFHSRSTRATVHLAIITPAGSYHLLGITFLVLIGGRDGEFANVRLIGKGVSLIGIETKVRWESAGRSLSRSTANGRDAHNQIPPHP